MEDLRKELSTLFFGETDAPSEFVVPLQGNWFVPQVADASRGTWIGFVVLETFSVNRSGVQGDLKTRPVQQMTRLTFLGPHAEEWANSTVFWDDRMDVKRAFERMNSQLQYNQRRIYTRVQTQEGLNDTLVWVVDITSNGFHYVEQNSVPWVDSI